MFYDATPNSFEKAKSLRNDSTKQERILWEFLRKKKILGVRIKRQHPIGSYIADFYCHAAKLVIEVDGISHNAPAQKLYDEERAFNFRILGLMLVRFSNDEVEHNLFGVISEITKLVQERLTHKTP